jgi:molybdate transport system permease protein
MTDKTEKFIYAFAGAIIVYMLISLFYIYVALGENWAQVIVALADRRVLWALGISISSAFLVGFLAIITGIPVAYLLAFKEFRGKTFVETVLIDMPQTFPPATLGLVYLLLFADWNIAYTYTAVIIAKYYVSAPFTINFITRRFKEIKAQGYDIIARSLGAKTQNIIGKVLIPLSISDIMGGYALTWARAMGELSATLVFAGFIPGVSETLPALVFQTANSAPEFSIAASIVGETASLIALMIFKKISKKKR